MDRNLVKGGMDRDEAQNELALLYSQWKSDFDSNGLIVEHFSPPLLLNVTEDYCAASIRVLVYGQETFGWTWDRNLTTDYPSYPESWTFLDQRSLKDFLVNEDAVQALCWGYAAFSFCQHQPKNYGSPFWRAFREIGKWPNVGVMWSNISRWDYKGGSIFEAPPSARAALERQQATLVRRELKVLEPDACIFLTGPRYDRMLGGIFAGINYISVGAVAKHRFARVEQEILPASSFRTYHPRYLSFGHNWNYLNAIRELILASERQKI